MVDISTMRILHCQAGIDALPEVWITLNIQRKVRTWNTLSRWNNERRTTFWPQLSTYRVHAMLGVHLELLNLLTGGVLYVTPPKP